MSVFGQGYQPVFFNTAIICENPEPAEACFLQEALGLFKSYLRSQEIKTRRKTGIIPFCAHLSIHKISWLLKDHCLWSRTVTEPGSFCLTHSKPKCWDTELGSRKDLSARQSSEETKEQASDLPPQKQGDWGIYGIKNKGAGWSEAWGAWGNVVGKTCDNHRSAQV